MNSMHEISVFIILIPNGLINSRQYCFDQWNGEHRIKLCVCECLYCMYVNIRLWYHIKLIKYNTLYLLDITNYYYYAYQHMYCLSIFLNSLPLKGVNSIWWMRPTVPGICGQGSEDQVIKLANVKPRKWYSDCLSFGGGGRPNNCLWYFLPEKGTYASLW